MSTSGIFRGAAVTSELGHAWEVGLSRVTFAVGPETGVSQIPGMGLKAPTANTSFNNDVSAPQQSF